jgi:hypothetical protein
MTSVAERLRLVRYSSTVKSDFALWPEEASSRPATDEPVPRPTGVDNGTETTTTIAKSHAAQTVKPCKLGARR